MKNKTLILTSVAALLLAACENPADKTTNATVSDGVKVASVPATDGVKYTLSPNTEILFTGSKVTGRHFSSIFTISLGMYLS